MDDTSFNDLQNMIPQFTQIVHRIVPGSWTNSRQVWQYHSLILVYDGEAVIGCNEERKVKRGDLIYFKPGDIRWGYTSNENPMKCYGMDFKYSCLLLDREDWVKKDIPLPLKSFVHINDSHYLSRVIYLFQRLVKEWISPETFNKIYRERSVFMEMLHLLFLWNNSRHTLNYDKIKKVEKVTEYILQHYAEKIKLQDLADSIHLSQSYLQVIFKEVTGNSPIEYLINIRMNKAKELMREAGPGIGEIAEQVGFSDPFYFSRCFKRLEGVSPNEYRKAVSEQSRFI
jgi:AraC-like DNA-binding protein